MVLPPDDFFVEDTLLDFLKIIELLDLSKSFFTKMSERSLTSSHGSGASVGSGEGRSPHRSPLPARGLAEKFDVHYVGSAPLGTFDVRLLNMSGLQKPLYNIYLDYLKTGGGTQKRQREVFFTELGVRVLREEGGATREVFLDYGTLLFWDSVTLRSFRSSGKKLYGMFESLRSDFNAMASKPDTLFQMDKKCPTLTMPAAPVVTFVNRPNPKARDLDCHALAFLSAEQAVAFVTTLAKRTKSYYEDYGTLAVDDVLFAPNDRVKNDFNKWKLTEDGWRLTSENHLSNDKKKLSKSQSEFIFMNFPKAASTSSAEADAPADSRDARSPLSQNANWRKPIRGRIASERSGSDRGSVEGRSRSVSDSQAPHFSDPDEMYEYGLSPGSSSPRGSQPGSRSPRAREVSPPVDYDADTPNASPAHQPKRIPSHMKTGVKVLPTIDPSQLNLSKGPSIDRAQSDVGYVSMRATPNEQPSGSGYSHYGEEASTSTESSNVQRRSSMKDKEIDSDLRNTVYLEGVDDDERSVSRTDFEQCLGYLP